MDLIFREFVVGQLSGQIILIGSHIHKPVPAPVEEDDLFLAFLFCLDGFTDNHGHGMVRLRGADEALRLGKGDARLEGLHLGDGLRPDDAVKDELADNGGHTVIPQPACVDGCRDKTVAEGIHGKQRRHLNRVPEIIGKGPSGQGGAGSGFNGDDIDLFSVDLVPDKGEAVPREITAPSGAADDDIRIITGNGELFLALQAVDGLMEHDMIQDTAQGIL